MIRLRLHVPGEEPKELGFDDPVIGIGRDQSNLIPLNDMRASRYHCQIEREDEHWKVVDNASANGTFVNGGQINFQRLEIGDRILIGDTQVEVLDLSAGRGPTGRASRRSAATRRSSGSPVGKPAAGPALRRGPTTQDDGQVSRRRPGVRRDSGTQVAGWTLAIVLGLFVVSWMVYDHAQQRFHATSLQAARSAMREALFEDAVVHAEKVPSSSKHYSEARSLISEINREKGRFIKNSLENRAAAAYVRLEEFTMLENTTRKDMRGYIDNFLKRYGESSFASRARGLIDLVPERGDDEGGSSQPVAPSDRPPTEDMSSLERVMSEADSYVARSQFGAAIEALSDFWSEHTGADAEAANARITELRAQADKKWKAIRFKVETHVKAGRKEKALKLLWEAHAFGIESIVEAVNRMTAEIERQ